MKPNKPDTKSKPRAMPEPHLDPWLIIGLAVIVVLAVLRVAAADPLAQVGPAPVAAPAPAPSATGIPALDLVVQLGVPAGLVVYLVVFGLPNIVKEFRAEVAAQREAHALELKAAREECEKEAARLERALSVGGVRDRPSGGA